VSLGSAKFYSLVEETRNQINKSGILSDDEKKVVKTTGYGHIGDGNLHLNVSVPGYEDPELQQKVEKVLEPFIFEFIKEAQGSVSAEHGIGRQKAKYLAHSKTLEMIAYMQRIKSVFDPKGIMNPYKVLPAKLQL